MREFDHTFTAGDNLPQIGGQLAGVDLTGYTITFQMQRPSTLLTKVATIPDQTVPSNLGMFSFPAWDDSDLVTGQLQKCDVQIANASGQLVTSEDFAINVKAAKS